MNKSISKILVAIGALLSLTACNAQIKNSKTEIVKIYGNCGMCEAKIEKAGNIKNVAKVDWNGDTKMATISYNAKLTNQDAILKRIANAGYDSDKFLAADNVYSKLHDCCQYDREAKSPLTPIWGIIEMPNHANHSETPIRSLAELSGAKAEIQEVNQLKAVFENYFAVKDALVKTEGNTASTKATSLLSAINAVKTETLTTDEHTVWIKILKNIKEHTEDIADTKDVKHQRDHFDTLSKIFYDLIKVSKQETPTYYQFCPMANDGKGANWLSKESVIKNPYYGSKMLSCGSVTEIIN
jgi:hypothetical protein